MPRFDSYLVVDWSAASTPKLGRDSIWSACAMPGSAIEVINHPTRRGFERWLHERLDSSAGRVLAGFDFSFGYPTGFAAAARLPGAPPWVATWQHLEGSLVDRDDNANDRFAVAGALNGAIGDGPGPFWGAPLRSASPFLASTKAPGFPHRGLAEYRRCELVMRAEGQRVFSSWQLLGAGSVGSQSLTGIPVLERLRRFGVRPVHVWPFTTGLALPALGPADVVLAEVWPGSIPLDAARHAVRDAAQVIGLAEHLARLDAVDALAASFAPAVADEDAAMVVAEEGWILGTGVTSGRA